jgi:hypothetical protein
MTDIDQNLPAEDRAGSRVGRRDALRVGGITLSLAALVAACGDDIAGSEAPGRVGYAPPVTDPPDYPVDDAVLLRTSSSVENTIISVYEEIRTSDLLDASDVVLIDRLLEDHGAISAEMGELTVAAGGEAWTCTNPWMMDRLVEPVMEVIASSDDAARDMLSFAISLESLGAATNQMFAVELSTTELRGAAIAAATLEARHSAALPMIVYGPVAYVSPALYNEDLGFTADGLPQWYSIPTTFGSIGQTVLVIGAADENGTRSSFFLQTPAANSYVYNETEPTC